jgi:outer membrane protein OmpA-like peptidoglycan-associated protein
MQKLKPLITIIVILNIPHTLWATPCDQANTLVKQAYALSNQPAQQKPLLQRALNLCPDFVPAHHNLGVIYENEHNDTKALHHYRQALKQRPDYYPAWVGIGDIYYKQKQLPLSLEAYLHACTRHSRARQRTRELLHNNRYRTAESGEVIKHQSLELLYDKARLQKLYQLATQCRQQYKSVASAADAEDILASVVVFRNINFKTGSAQIDFIYQSQLDEIALALNSKYNNKIVNIGGHTDEQPWAGETQARSDELNQQLSEQRANAIKSALAQRGVPEKNMTARGYGSRIPIERGHTESAWAKNRRVVIMVDEDQ